MPESGKGTRTRKVLFVFGSGVSLESGVPDVKKLTHQILKADNALLPKWFRRVNGEKEVAGIIEFLELLKKEHERTGEEANYEDLFSLCQKIYEHEVGISTDGSIIRFRDHIYRESAHLWKFYIDGGYLGEAPLGAIADRATFMITDCLKKILAGYNEPKGLGLLTDTIESLGVESVDVLTLNHDVLIECLLQSHDVPFTTGFDVATSRSGEVDFFEESAFTDLKKVRIIKLHGSWDWIRLGKKIDEATTLWRWGVPNQSAEWHDCLKDADGDRLIDNPFEKATLTGSTTKTTAYTRGIFGDLYIEARKLMREHDTIICSGYGWKDDGFNWMVKEWAENDLDRRLLLLHDREDDRFENRKPWIWPREWNWDNQLGWLKWHPNWLCHTTMKQIEGALFN